MSKRITTCLVVLAVLAWGAPTLHAQSLSSKQKETLDGRFERIVQKANQGTLEAEIDRFLKKVKRLQEKTASKSKDLTVQEQLKRLQKGESPLDDATPLESMMRDIQPDTRRNGDPLYGAIVHTDNPSALERAGVQIGSVFDQFATVYAAPSELAEISQLSAVEQVRSPREYEPHNDEAAAEVGARTLNHGVGGTKYTGEDVMTCIIDSGIDWDHPDFTDENGQSRIRYIWDQVGDATQIKPPSANNPSRFGPDFNAWYGDEYMPRHIQSGTVFEVDENGHGTHVAGTVTSSGMAHKQTHGVKKYQGMAPDADIVAVKTRFSSVSIIDGINYCKKVAEAEGKPVVVNMSLGSPFGPHDGTSPLALATESLTAGGQASGMVVVASAGNSGSPSNPIHTGPTTLSAGDSADVEINVPEHEEGLFDQFLGDMWMYTDQSYSISLYTPGMTDTLSVDVEAGASSSDTLTTAKGQVVAFSQPGILGQKRNVFFFLQGGLFAVAPTPAAGTWTVRVRNTGDQNTTMHGWSDTNISNSNTGELAAFVNANNQYTIGSPSTSRGAISVGSYTHRTRWSTVNGAAVGFPASTGIIRDRISSFSSRGPAVEGPHTVSGGQKPEITAPGQIMISSLSGDAFVSRTVQVGENHWGTQGTSMSSPTVAGSVALLLQEDASLSTNRVRSLLTETARVDANVEAQGGAWNRAFGHGKLNVTRALMQLRQSTQDPKQEVLAYEDPFNFISPDQAVTDSIGPDGAAGLALRFTPTMSGFFSGAYVSIGANDVETNFFGEVTGINDFANELTDSVRVQVYTDSSGVPGDPMGTPVMVPPEQFGEFTPNHVDFHGAGVSVESGTDYHLVLRPGDEETGDLEVLAETAADSSGRSMRSDGSSWSSTGNDLVIRAQVTGDVSAPSAVAGAELTSEEAQNVGISWNPVDEAAQYLIYRSTNPLPKSTSGLTPIDTVQSGTTTYTDGDPIAGWTYYYRVAAVNEKGNEGEASSQVQTFLYPQNVTANISRSFGSAPAGESGATYRLVAMPGTADQPLQETLDGEAGLDWQAYAESGSGLVQFDGSGTFTMSAGNGFWLTSTSTWSSNAEVSTVQLQGDSAATVSLSDGWNIVSNPTGKDVPFSMIQAAHSDTLQRPMGWNGSWYVADTMHSASSGVAYYFNNTEGLDALTIPYPGSPHVGSRAAPKTAKESPALVLSARSTAKGSPASTVKVDFRPQAANGLDARDLIAPTDHFEAVSLRLQAPAPNAERSRDLLVERRSTIDASARNGHTFDLRLNSEVNGPMQISARNLTAVEDYEVSLIHSAAGKTHDLRRTEQVTITPDGKTTPLKLAVGTKAYVENQTEDVVPDEVSLSSYPNPLRQQATVEYALPETENVRLVLYDVLGREVAVLENGRKDAGHHTVRLDGGQLSSGVYFGRLKAGDKQVTKKITVVR